MSRLVSRAENWEQIYTSFQQVNFAAFDYDTIKHSLLDYLKIYFPESFNDFIESDEIIAIVEMFSYIASIISYRLDMDAHENFLSTAQRKESILRLAKLVSYAADRPIPARGLVKITSISTSEGIIDSVGNNLAGKPIRWNDTSNIHWKDQFIAVMDSVLAQQFGTVNPTDRFQLQDVLFDLYNVNSVPMQSGVFKYTTTINGQQIPMELVPVSYDSTLGIVERRPVNNSNFTFLYGQDGLGDSSETTGFMCFTKQGSLTRFRQVFDGVTPNQTFEVPIDNINNIDVWLNCIDPLTGDILNTTNALSNNSNVKTGEWVEVDNSGSYNVIFNTEESRSKYEVETRVNNRIRLIFGDGNFADIPSGAFDIWVRTSIDQDIIISQTAVIDKQTSFNYVDALGRIQTFTFTFSLINSLQNGSAAESLEHIRLTAPAVYYTQDRMVNGRDYNTYMTQDSSILKMRSINRTFAGDSKYINWHDPSSTYEDVKMFGNDGTLYYDLKKETSTTPIVDVNTLISTYVEPLLSSSDVFIRVTSESIPVDKYRRKFSSSELAALYAGLTPPPSPSNVNIYYCKTTFEWKVISASSIPGDVFIDPPWTEENYITTPILSIKQTQPLSLIQNGTTYEISRYANRLIFHSPTTRFWNTNLSSKVIDYNTLKSDYDVVSILQANLNYNRSGILSNTWNFNILGQEVYDSVNSLGLTDITRVSLLPVDANYDGIPDYLDINDIQRHQGLADIIKPKLTYNFVGKTIPTSGYTITLPIHYITGLGDVKIHCSSLPNEFNGIAQKGLHWDEITNTPRYQMVNIGGNKNADSPTGLANSASPYHTKITIDGQLIDIIINGDLVQTIGELVDKLNQFIGNLAKASIMNGNIKITSYSTDMKSSVLIEDDTLFSSLNDAESLLITTPTIVAVSNEIVLFAEGGTAGLNNHEFFITVNDYVYFYRGDKLSNWSIAPLSIDSLSSYIAELRAKTGTWTRKIGRTALNFAWFHRSNRYHLIDPAPSNIIDTFIIQKGYFLDFKRWIENTTYTKPDDPTPLDLRLAYNSLLSNGMQSDTVILYPGTIKLLFGQKAHPTLQAIFKVIKSPSSTLSDNQIKNDIVTIIRNYFDISYWEFGETFYFSEMSAVIHSELPNEISSIVIVPIYDNNHFGSLFQINAREDEILYPDVSVSDIEIISSYNETVLRIQ